MSVDLPIELCIMHTWQRQQQERGHRPLDCTSEAEIQAAFCNLSRPEHQCLAFFLSTKAQTQFYLNVPALPVLSTSSSVDTAVVDFFQKLDPQLENIDAKSWLIGKHPDAGRDWGQEKGTTGDEMAGWHHRLDGHEFGWTPGVGDGQGGLVCCDSWGRRESDMTEHPSNMWPALLLI